MSDMPNRRAVLGAGIALAGTTALAPRVHAATPAPAPSTAPARTPSAARAADRYVAPDGPEVREAEARRGAGPLRKVSLTATTSRLELGGGLTVPTWSYGDRLPGRAVRVTAGDTLALTLANHLPQSTTVHWHGLSVRNDMDGVPGLTQRPIEPGAEFAYRFAVTRPGTYWLHSHSGVQLDRGLYAPLIVDDPREPLAYDKEWVVVLDDWLDGIGGATPDAVLDELTDGRGGSHGTSPEHGASAGHGATAGRGTTATGPDAPSHVAADMNSELLGGHAGDVAYPHYLVNGRRASAPSVFEARPGDRIRLRVVNAGGDTAFRLALGGHRMTVTHSDGFPVQHTETGALLLGMGERYDVLVTAGDGVFPLTALAEGKGASALAVLRTAPGALPPAGVRPAELDGPVLTAGRLAADESVALPAREPDRTVRLSLTGSMKRYDWAFDGRPYDPAVRRPVRAGERVRLVFENRTAMWHPLHLHGHTFALTGADGRRSPGARKDTAVILPWRSLTVDLDADNPGLWMLHCHNLYHAESGMMTVLGYLR